MKTEVPLCRRCCFCMPLRYGLLIWGYLVLMPITVHMITEAFEFYFVVQVFQYYHAIGIIRFLVTFLVKTFNLALTILLIVACHKKDTHLMKVYYTYGLVAVTLYAVLVITSVVYDVVTYWEYRYIGMIIDYLPIQLGAGVIVIGLQLYIIALVRSEILKLENSNKFEFHNIAAEAECGYYEPNGGRTDQDSLQVDTTVATCNEVTKNSHLNNENNCVPVKIENDEVKTADIVKTKNKINVLNAGLNAVVNKNVGYDKVVNEE